jgi:hypothetical protein
MEPKPWWKSRAVWAAAIFFGKSLATGFGVIIPPVVDQIIDAISGILGTVGVRGWVLGSGTGKSA